MSRMCNSLKCAGDPIEPVGGRCRRSAVPCKLPIIPGQYDFVMIAPHVVRVTIFLFISLDLILSPSFSFDPRS